MLSPRRHSFDCESVSYSCQLHIVIYSLQPCWISLSVIDCEELCGVDRPIDKDSSAGGGRPRSLMFSVPTERRIILKVQHLLTANKYTRQLYFYLTVVPTWNGYPIQTVIKTKNIYLDSDHAVLLIQYLSPELLPKNILRAPLWYLVADLVGYFLPTIGLQLTERESALTLILTHS